jgi:hypothetical protein
MVIRDQYKHVGKKWLICDVGFHVSGAIRAITEPSVPDDATAKNLHDAVIAAVKSVLEPLLVPGSDIYWHGIRREDSPYGLDVQVSSGVIRPEEVEKAEWDANLESLRKSFAESRAASAKARAENPNNGTDGFWWVSGVRHETTVRATTAQEAYDKAIASGDVGDWEHPSVEFRGTDI